MPEVKTILSKSAEAATGAPNCDVCGKRMRKSTDPQGNPIWICPLAPYEHPFKPRQE